MVTPRLLLLAASAFLLLGCGEAVTGWIDATAETAPALEPAASGQALPPPKVSQELKPTLHCYRTLGQIDCYAQPEPAGNRQAG